MAMKPQALDQQVIVLTGASGVIGLCTAELAARQGAKLVLVAHANKMLDNLIAAIRSSGGEAIHVAADVAVREQVAAAAHAAIHRFGQIDAWINSAGVSIYGRLDQVSEADSRHLFDVNFWGVVNGSLVALPYLISADGSLINVGPDIPETAVPLLGMYASSKQAVKGFTDALRAEIEEMDRAPVTITLIQPSVFDPEQIAQAILCAAAKRPRGRTSARALAAALPVPCHDAA